MEKLINWLETSFQPKMSVVNTNVWVTTLKDSMLQMLPMIFVGFHFSALARSSKSSSSCLFPFGTPIRLDHGPALAVRIVPDPV